MPVLFLFTEKYFEILKYFVTFLQVNLWFYFKK